MVTLIVLATLVACHVFALVPTVTDKTDPFITGVVSVAMGDLCGDLFGDFVTNDAADDCAAYGSCGTPAGQNGAAHSPGASTDCRTLVL